MLGKGISWEKHDINDDRRRQEAIQEVKKHWSWNQNDSEKINGWTMTEFLGETWENNFKNKKGKEVIKERDWLIKKIDDAKSAK